MIKNKEVLTVATISNFSFSFLSSFLKMHLDNMANCAKRWLGICNHCQPVMLRLVLCLAAYDPLKQLVSCLSSYILKYELIIPDPGFALKMIGSGMVNLPR